MESTRYEAVSSEGVLSTPETQWSAETCWRWSDVCTKSGVTRCPRPPPENRDTLPAVCAHAPLLTNLLQPQVLQASIKFRPHQ